MPFGPLMISVSGHILTPEEKELLPQPKIGGVILFKENFSSKKQLNDLIFSIRELNKELLVTVDHEGGHIWRFDKGFSHIPAAKSYGALYEQDQQQALTSAGEDAYTMATELLSCGIDFSFAPVLDSDWSDSQIIGKYERAFHSEPLIISNIARAFAQGMQKAGMPVTGKHFPDHGLCIADSHKELPKDSRLADDIIGKLTPYKTLIAEKLLDIIMPAHVVYSNLDDQYPAGFSKKIIQDILRSKLGFQGAIISDCLSMHAVTDIPAAERVRRALNAGQDMTIFAKQPAIDILELLPEILDNSDDSKARLSKLLQSNYEN